ncbi:MAG: hypothetical protein R2739_01250 [Chitinophagales bacterium]
MNNIYKILFFFLCSLFLLNPNISVAKDQDSGDINVTFRSIWKYEMEHPKYSPEDGIAKKIFYLSLNSDGTFHQYVQIIPLTPQDYFRVKNYTVDGKWKEKDGKLILTEYGKENSIDFNYIFNNFENIDNQYIATKK